MTARRLVIAIDGPAASGKSSTAHAVAERLNLQHVDSGSLYRALTAVALAAAVPPVPDSWPEAELLAQVSRVGLRNEGRECAPTIDGAPAGDAIRSAEVTRRVSAVAAVPAVRAWVNDQVRRMAEVQDLVVDGRDIGTAVFPDAALKVFLVADPRERARRRLVQRLGRTPAEAEIAQEAERLVERDARDATQTVPARDAVVMDTTHLTQAEQVDRIVALARALTHGDDVSSAG
ncbi:MAG TPA: (d)CMP kinase [Gemmatimonadaceae bacterium]|jgi:cytidylate kinase|nr:(d)CMP kinase [Gemmatimonadaceae bacterium]